MSRLCDGLANPVTYGKFTDAFVDELAAFFRGKRVLEVFAGNGALASLLARKGVSVTATSLFMGHDGHEMGNNFPVIEMDAAEAVLSLGDDHDVLLICWPTVTNRVTVATQLWGAGREFVYIGEFTDYSKNQLGGCADDEFFETIESFVPFASYRGSMYEQGGVMKVRALEDRYRMR